MNELISGFIGSIIGSIASIYSVRQNLNTESGWRSKVFDAAAAPAIKLEQIYTLRTAIKYDFNQHDFKIYSFDWLTNKMILFCNFIISKYENVTKDTDFDACSDVSTDENKELASSLTFEEQQIARIFLRCLLKHNWDYNASMLPSIKLLKSNQNTKSRDFIEISWKKIDILLENSNCSELEAILKKTVGN